VGVAGLLALAATTPSWPVPSFGDAFWRHWGDNRAELAAYDFTTTRYGEPRAGSAVAIFVTETFSQSARVKADPGRHPKSDEFPAMKLNLVEDFATGIYDYNLMTSSFVALTPVGGRPAGSATKVSFSSQEWCGHVWDQVLFDATRLRRESHSYFDGEADRRETLPHPQESLAEDALLLWARGLAAPSVARGESRGVNLLGSLKTARLLHQPLAWRKATLSRAPGTRRVSAPAGDFEVEVATAVVDGGPRWTFQVESAWPHRIVEWENSDGERARLLGAERLTYWKLNGTGGESALAKLGLKPRPARTP
jgi:hypothetical protein